MKILALEKEIDPATDWRKHAHLLEEEARLVWQFQKSGFIRDIAFTRETNKAVITLECKDEVEARQLLDQLPLVAGGLITFEIIGLKAYTGFDRLFDVQEK